MTKQRYEAIDALRGVAALGVVLYHLALYYDETYDYLSMTIPGWFEAFRYGPHFFYMISGFVIFVTLGRHRGFRNFMRARLVRLLPAFWVCLPAAALVGTLFGPEDAARTWLDVLTNAFFLQGVFGADHVDLAYWSLLVEMAFYLMTGVLFATLGLDRKLTLLLTLWLIVAFVGMWFYNDLPILLDIVVKELLIVRYAIFFIPGIIFYCAVRDGWLRHSHKVLLACSVLLMIASLPMPFGVMMAVLTGVLYLAIQGRLDWLLCYRPLLWLGSISYPLYLVHQVLGTALIYNLQNAGFNELGALSLAIGMSVVLAWLIHRYIERPCWKKLRKIR